MTKIDDKIKEVEKFLVELRKIVPETLVSYKKNIEKRYSCERLVEKIVEALTDLAFIYIKSKNFDIPEDDIDAFSILMENKVIDEDTSKRLKDAKGMRNIIIHQYGRINDEMVFHSIKEELEHDAKGLMEALR